MDTQQFLGTLLSDSGKYCLFAAQGKKGDPNHRTRTKFYNTISELIAGGTAANKAHWDTWFGLFTFDDEGRRKAVNAHEVQSFFVDVDCGEGKPYYTQREGAIALTAFCKRTGLPAPAQVNSGYGIHAYWLLREPISRDIWKPIAEKFKQLTIHYNFEVDNAVTADAARVLRLPGTINYKFGDEKRCRVMGDTLPEPIDLSVLEEVVDNAPIAAPAKRSGTVDKLYRDEQAKLHANKVCKFKNIFDKTVEGVGCPQVAYLINNRATLEEPLWRAGLSLARVCADKEKAVKILSKGYPGFNLPEAYKKMNETAAPYTCATLDGLNPGVCDNCPIKDRRFDSPIALGMEFKKATEADNTVPVNPKPPTSETKVLEGHLEPEELTHTAVATIPTYPAPYFRPQGGGVGVRITEMNKDTEKYEVREELIYPYDLYALERVRDREEGESLVMRVHMPMDPMNEFHIPMNAIGGGYGDTLQRKLGFHGVISSQFKPIGRYIMEWVKKLQSESIVTNARSQFGWDEEVDSFSVGNKTILRGGKVVTNYPSTVTSSFFKYFEPKGTLNDWRRAMNYFNRKGMETHQFVICTAFGAPLMEFIPNVQAAAMHIYSGDSGLGKTTAIWAAASVWGNYKELANSAGDTRNSTLLRAEILKNLPLYVDELTNVDGDELSNYVLSITNGKQRNRMTGSANKERERGDPWGLIAVSTGNTSVSEKISTKKAEARAEAQRLLEVRVKDFAKATIDPQENWEFNELLEGNFGHAGPIYMQYVQRQRDEIEAFVINVHNKVATICGMDEKNRFWVAEIACSVAGGIIAQQAGLLDFDMEYLMKVYSKQLVNHNRNVLNSAHLTPEELINEYYMENYANTLVIDGSADSRSKTKVIPERMPKGKLLQRYEPNTSMLYIAIPQLRAWCVNTKRANYEEVFDHLKKQYGAIQKQTRLNRGVDATDTTNPKCLIVDASRFLNSSVVDDADDSET